MTDQDIIDTHQDIIDLIEMLPPDRRATLTKRVAAAYRFNDRPAVPEELKTVWARMPTKNIWDIIAGELHRLARCRASRTSYHRKKKPSKMDLQAQVHQLEDRFNELLTTLRVKGILQANTPESGDDG